MPFAIEVYQIVFLLLAVTQSLQLTLRIGSASVASPFAFADQGRQIFYCNGGNRR